MWEGERLVEVLAGPATFDVPSPASGVWPRSVAGKDDRVEAGFVLGPVATADLAADGSRTDLESAIAGKNRCSVALYDMTTLYATSAGTILLSGAGRTGTFS